MLKLFWHILIVSYFYYFLLIVVDFNNDNAGLLFEKVYCEIENNHN